METGGLEEKREEGREAEQKARGWGRKLESIMDRQWPPAHGSALTGAWCLVLLGCRDAGALPNLSHHGSSRSWGVHRTSGIQGHLLLTPGPFGGGSDKFFRVQLP